MRKSVKFLFVLPFLFFIQACNAMPTEDVKPVMQKKPQEMQWRTGTIQFMEFEGGFFGLVTDKGEKLLPMNLAKEYQQVGAIVKVQGKFVTDMMTIQQWGTPYKITKIELIKAGKPRADSKLY